MQKYTYSPSLVVQCGNSTYCYPTIVDACSSYVGTKGLYIQKNSSETGFIPFTTTTNYFASKVRVAVNSTTTCSPMCLIPYIVTDATTCSVACKSDTYDPGTYTTYVKNFKVSLEGFGVGGHSCPYALRCSYDICLYDSVNGWRKMTTLTCNSNCATASTYQFSNTCIRQWRVMMIYIFLNSSSCELIGYACAYMPQTPPNPGVNTCCKNDGVKAQLPKAYLT